MSPLRLLTFLALLLAGAVGCGVSQRPEGPTTGSLSLTIALDAAKPPEDITRVTVTLTGSDFSPITTDLVLTDGVWSGLIGDVPQGPSRLLQAQAFDAANTLRYQGTTSVFITPGATFPVVLTLHELAPPFTDEAPIIDSVVANPSTVTPGGVITLTVNAHDPDPGDTLHFAWTGSDGVFSAPTQASTTWTTSSIILGPRFLTLQVSDSRGATLTVNLTVNVSTTTSGSEQVKTDFNTAPRLGALRVSPFSLKVGQPAALTVSASDADGDPLGYQWSATCAGTFTGADTPSATFTPSALPAAACNNCQLSVVVKDGRGGQGTGSLALCVSGDAAVPHAPPTILHSFQSSVSATAGQTLAYEVEASDPAGSALGFSWTSTAGTPGSATSSATRSRVTWVAPACVGKDSSPSVTATVTNTFGVSASRRFLVLGLPTCGTPSWSTKGALATARGTHTATLLPNGKVLVSGGAVNGTGAPLATAELYEPATGTWSATGSMSVARADTTAVLLPNGQVLVPGGKDTSSALATAELYNPATGTWSATGSMSTPRYRHTVTLLPNGKVLVSGGYGNSFVRQTTAELYDPATGTWSAAGSMSVARVDHTATLLLNGKVLVAGGQSDVPLVNAELYDPATGAWSSTGSMSLPHLEHTATLLPNGQVLVSGGYLAAISTVAELYDPTAGVWIKTGSMGSARIWHTATLLSTGQVLVVGGQTAGPTVATAELYDPVTGLWSAAGAMSRARYLHTAIRLPGGQVLIVGGFHSGDDPDPTELYSP